MNLLEELKADQDPRSQCRLCTWLQTLTEADRKEWASAMLDRSFTHASIFRAAQRRGYGAGKGTVESHRASGHKP
ncbi:MAG: hypothetical protein V1757_04085 [Actinomycetota bacterium]